MLPFFENPKRELGFPEEIEEIVNGFASDSSIDEASFVFFDQEKIIVPFSFQIRGKSYVKCKSLADARNELATIPSSPPYSGYIFRSSQEIPKVCIDRLHDLFNRSVIRRNIDRDTIFETQSKDDIEEDSEGACKRLAMLFPMYNFALASVEKTLRVSFLFGTLPCDEKDFLTNHLLKELIKKTHPVQKKDGDTRFVVFPISHQYGIHDKEAVEYIVLWCNSPILLDHIHQIENFINNYASQRNVLSLPELISELQHDVIKALASQSLSNHQDFDNSLKEILNRAFRIIINHTLAKSITFRRLNCSSNTLDIFFDLNEPGFSFLDKIDRSISIKCHKF